MSAAPAASTGQHHRTGSLINWVFKVTKARIDLGGLTRILEMRFLKESVHPALRLVTGAATIGAMLVLPLASAASAASPTISVGSYPYGVAINPSTNTVDRKSTRLNSSH